MTQIDSSKPATVLLVGRRRRALEAALALDLEVVVVAEKPPRSRRHVDVFECSLEVAGSDWPALAARVGEGRRIVAVLALTERAVVPAAHLRRHLGLSGEGTDVAVRVTDKLEMKRAIAAAGIPCTPFLEVGPEIDGDRLIDELGLPLVIKARVGSGGRSNQVVRRRSEMPSQLPQGYMAEAFVTGTEMSFESLVVADEVVFTNPTEYFRVRWASIVPASLPTATLEAIAALNLRALRTLGVFVGVTHLELFLTPRGPVFSELAARPPGGYLTELIDLAYGFDFWQTLLRIVLGERPELPRTAHRTAGAWLFHPGPGLVAGIAGVKAARSVPGVERLHLRVEPGMQVGERRGSGQEAGHLLVTGRDRDEVAERLRRAHRLVRFRKG